MAKETIGYVYMRWTCPNCDTKNLGTDRFCANCGSAQPDNIQFEQSSQEELIKDQAELEKAKLGPDIHCPYCGSRNRADAAHCTQCGGALAQGAKRETGRVVGAHRSGPAAKVTCPACGTPNEPDADKCVQCGASLAPKPKPKPKAEPAKGGFLGVGLIVGVVVVLCILGVCAFVFLAGQTEETTGQVVEVEWTRTVPIMGLVPVTKEDWRDELPDEAEIVSCREELHHTQDEPDGDAEKVCGTPFTVDQGSGFGEVVQECVFNVYQDFCEYTVNEWQEVDEVSVSGNDFDPYWPEPDTGRNQRLGTRSEAYQVVFRTEAGEYSYSADADEFEQFQPGTRWKLNVNTFNSVVSVEPQ